MDALLRLIGQTKCLFGFHAYKRVRSTSYGAIYRCDREDCFAELFTWEDQNR